MNRPAKFCRTPDQATLDPSPIVEDPQNWRTALSYGEGLIELPPALSYREGLVELPPALSYGENLLDLPPVGDDPKISPPIPALDPADPPAPDDRPKDRAQTQPRELGGRPGPDPTRYGDWELKGRCIDF